MLHAFQVQVDDDKEDEDDTVAKEEEERSDYWRNMVDRIREEEMMTTVTKREEPTLEPPILDFCLTEPAREKVNYNRIIRGLFLEI